MSQGEKHLPGAKTELQGLSQLARALAGGRASDRAAAVVAHLREFQPRLTSRSVDQSAALRRLGRSRGPIVSALKGLTLRDSQTLTIAEAATWLGRSRTTIRRRIRKGDLDAIRHGRTLFVRGDQLWQLRTQGLAVPLGARESWTASGKRPNKAEGRKQQATGGEVGQWVATVDGEIVVAADTAKEVVAWLTEEDKTADSLYRLPARSRALEGAAPG